jgi:hypothetical protein
VQPIPCGLHTRPADGCPLLRDTCRTRGDASDFTAALDDYRQYLRRKAAAEAMRAEYEAAEPSAEEGGTGSSSAAGPSLDLSLKPGQKITLKLSGVSSAEAGSRSACAAGVHSSGVLDHPGNYCPAGAAHLAATTQAGMCVTRQRIRHTMLC